MILITGMSGVYICRCVPIHRNSAGEFVNPRDNAEAIVGDVVYQNKSAGSCPASPALFIGTDVTISEFKVCRAVREQILCFHGRT